MRRFVTAGALAFAISAAGVSSASAQNEFSWRGRLGPGQTLEIKGINGSIHAISAGSGEAEVTAEKSARRSDPASVQIEVVPHAGGVTICAVYPSDRADEPNRCVPGRENRSRTRDNDTTVKFEVRVPAGVTLAARTVNGGVDLDSLASDADAHTVNGSVRVSTSGVATATTVNGSLDVKVGRADWPEGIAFSTVNGAITLSLPPSTNAAVRASTVNGSIKSDFPIVVQGTFSRRRLEGTIGAGGQTLKLSTVNGSIQLIKGH